MPNFSIKYINVSLRKLTLSDCSEEALVFWSIFRKKIFQ
jgi:hypothetical protein